MLYEIVKQNKDKFKAFKIDKIFSEAGHTVLRLPPYHPDLNPIEMIWAQVKGYVAQRNTTFRLDNAMELASEKINMLTDVDWKKVCEHVIQIEDAYAKNDHILDNITEQFIIEVSDSSDDENESVQMEVEQEDGDDYEYDSDLGCEPL